LSLRAKDGNITGGQFQMACGPVFGRIVYFYLFLPISLPIFQL